MSTEHQQYSTSNQAIAIIQYAERHNMDIVRTYADHGKSGLLLKTRPGLQQLLSDAVEPEADFKAVLVFDVSRFGRFQNPDQGASYEYTLALANVPIHYCAEPFANDGTLASSIIKTVKRGMAGEFSRELSGKVWAGCSRLASLGYHVGGKAGYGLRRQLVDQDGNFKQLLKLRERKSIHTDRVILVPGPAKEVRIIHQIYEMYIDRRLTEFNIATKLNSRNVPWIGDRPWTPIIIREILTNPKYIGTCVYNRKSYKLHKNLVRNEREAWICKERAFRPIVTDERFEQARQLFVKSRAGITKQILLHNLRDLIKREGRVSVRLIESTAGMHSPHTYVSRFGSLRNAYRLAGWKSAKQEDFLNTNLIVSQRRTEVVERIVQDMARVGVLLTYDSQSRLFTTDLGIKISITVMRCIRPHGRADCWYLYHSPGPRTHLKLLVRLTNDNGGIQDYYIFPSWFLGTSRLTLKARNSIDLDAFRCESFDTLIASVRRRMIEDGPYASEPDSASRELMERASIDCIAYSEPRLARLYRICDSDQKAFVDRAYGALCRVSSLRNALKQLIADEDFRTLLRAESYTFIPESLLVQTSSTVALSYSTKQSGLLGTHLSLRRTGMQQSNVRIGGGTNKTPITGVCPAAVKLLERYSVPPNSFKTLSQMLPERQLEVAEHMIARNIFDNAFLRFHLYSTRSHLRTISLTRKSVRYGRGWSASVVEKISSENERWLADVRGLPETVGETMVALVVCEDYVSRILRNDRVRRFIGRRHFVLLGTLESTV